MRALGIALTLALVAGCATMKHGGTQPVTITSDPPGALVTIDKYKRGVTPLALDLERRESAYRVEVELEGHAPQYFEVDGEFQAGDALGTSIIGLPVDAASGALWELKPNVIHLDMSNPSANRFEYVPEVKPSDKPRRPPP